MVHGDGVLIIVLRYFHTVSVMFRHRFWFYDTIFHVTLSLSYGIFFLENPHSGLMYHLYEIPYIFAIHLEIIVKKFKTVPWELHPLCTKRGLLFVLISRENIWSSDGFQAASGRFHWKCRYWRLYLWVEVGRHYCLIMLCNTYPKISIFPTQKETQQLRSKEPGVSTLCYILHKYFMPPFGSIKLLFREV